MQKTGGIYLTCPPVEENMRKHQSQGRGLLLLHHRRTYSSEISSARKSMSRVLDFIEEFYWFFFLGPNDKNAINSILESASERFKRLCE